jgi:hypothetical protein
MNAEFNWWLLIVGLVLGAALTWLVMAETTRRDADLTESEQRGEALWIATVLSSSGQPIEGERVEEVLRLHREYLAAPVPDDPHEDGPAPAAANEAETDRPAPSDWPQAGASAGRDAPGVDRDRPQPEPAVADVDEAGRA